MYHFILIPILELPHTPLSLMHRIENYTPIYLFFLLSFNCNIWGIHLPSFRKNLRVHHLGVNVFANGVNAQRSTIDIRGGKKLRLKSMF
jgi:hypothetical protein